MTDSRVQINESFGKVEAVVDGEVVAVGNTLTGQMTQSSAAPEFNTAKAEDIREGIQAVRDRLNG